jgi:hypothetical protein
MRRVFLSLCVVLVAAAGFASAKKEVRDFVDQPFSADFAAGGELRLRIRSGEVHVIGTDQNRISVELSGRKVREAHDVRVTLAEKRGVSELRVSGGPKNDLTITIRVPKATNLYARIPFGEVHVEGVEGDKDISIHAGDLTVSVGRPDGYARVDASVMSGELDGEPFGESHGGLFRSFHKKGSGKYRLYAHVGAGQLTLR